MKRDPVLIGRRMMHSARIAMMAALPLLCGAATAQQTDNKPTQQKPDLRSYQTLALTNTTDQREGNDVVTDLRNMLPDAKIYYVQSEDVISMRGTPEDFQLAQKLLSEIDKPRRAYRLTYTIATMEEGKRVGAQSFALIAVASEGKTLLKQGNKVPIVTGTESKNASGPDTQVQYIDVGLAIEASLQSEAHGVRLQTKINQSSIADERSGIAVADPVIHQTVLEATSDLQPGKPVVLGSLALPGNAGHEEVEVVSEPVQ